MEVLQIIPLHMQKSLLRPQKNNPSIKALLNSQIGYKDESNWLTDAMVNAHTTTKITTTNKSQLNSAIVYNDQIEIFFIGTKNIVKI